MVATAGCRTVSGRGEHRSSLGRALPRVGAAGMVIAAHGLTAARTRRPHAPNGASSKCGSSAAGGQRGSPTYSDCNVSTVHRVLTRYGLAKLRWLTAPTGRVIRRMESAACGDLVHVDVKKLGKIPAGGGWRKLGQCQGRENSRADKSSGIATKNGDAGRGLSLPAHRHRRALAAGLLRNPGR